MSLSNARPVDDNKDGINDVLRTEDGRALPLVDVPEANGWTMRIAAVERRPPPPPPEPEQVDLDVWIANLQAKAASDVASAKHDAQCQIDHATSLMRVAEESARDAANRAITVGNQRDKMVAKAKRNGVIAWVGWIFTGLSTLLFVVYYSLMITKQIKGDVDTIIAPSSAGAEAWLESVKPLLDDPDSSDDDYSRGRKALGLD